MKTLFFYRAIFCCICTSLLLPVSAHALEGRPSRDRTKPPAEKVREDPPVAEPRALLVGDPLSKDVQVEGGARFPYRMRRALPIDGRA